MNGVIGDILPLALGVAISPVPMIAVILMLLAPRAKASAWSFLAGWVGGITVVVTVVTLVIDPADDSDQGSPSTLSAVIKLALGAGLLLLAVAQWRSQPGSGEEAKLPAWMAAIDHVTPLRAAGLGALLSGVNPKNLALCIGGAVAIGAGDISAVQSAIAIAIFVGIGSISVAVPVIGYTVAQTQMRGFLDSLRVWLTVHNAAVMAILLLVIGVSLIGKGIAGL